MRPEPHVLRWPGGELLLDSCKVMGILNVTPDSFSDGGKFRDPRVAIERAREIVREGADLLDIGAESTRPGAEAVSEAAERERLWPVLETLKVEGYPLPISLDSAKPGLVDAALSAGLIQIVNDVEGLRNQDMAAVVKARRAPVILMHMFGTPRTMQKDFSYKDVVTDLIGFFETRMEETGLRENVVLDPGIGFGKSVEHNLLLLRRLPEFFRLGCPVLVGASRKSFIGQVLDVTVEERLEGSLAAAAVAAFQGVSIVRAHDVRATVRAVRLAGRIRGASAA